MSLAQEPCPRCGTIHTRGDYEKSPHGPEHRPRDIKCGCGLVLRWGVPFFKTTASGYVLRLLRTDEKEFL